MVFVDNKTTNLNNDTWASVAIDNETNNNLSDTAIVNITTNYDKNYDEKLNSSLVKTLYVDSNKISSPSKIRGEPNDIAA